MTRAGLADPALWAMFARAADRGVRLSLFGALACALGGGVLAALAPVALKGSIDALVVHRVGSPIWGALFCYIAALGVQRLCEQGQAFFFGVGEQRMQQRLNGLLFAHALRLPMDFHLAHKGGALIETLGLGLQGARIIMTHAVMSFTPLIVQAGFVLAVAANLFDVALWATLCGAIIAYGGVFALGLVRLHGPSAALATAQIETGAAFAEGLSNIEPVKSFAAEARVSGRYDRTLGETERHWRVFYTRRLENGAAATLVFVLALTALMVQAGLSVLEGRLGPGGFVLIHAYALQLVRPLEMAGFALRDIAHGSRFLARWSEILAVDAEPFVAFSPRAAHTKAPSLRFENVSFGYGANARVLKGVSFSVDAGQCVAIVGPSGAGKSSILRLLMRYFEPCEGSIFLDGAPLHEMERDRLRAAFAVVSQDTILFHDSLEANIRFARPQATAFEFSAALKAAQLEEVIARLPRGLETMVGERGLKLSGGERQRVAIARALLKQAPVLVLDEATSALDARTEAEIAAALMGAAQGRTTLLVTHRLALARLAERIIVLEAGAVVEEGAHVDLMRAEGVYARLWRVQSEIGKA